MSRSGNWEEISEPAEMYLQTIFRLTDTRGEARTKVIADTLGITMGSVTNTIRGLQRLGLVKRRAYHGVTLTPEGRRIAVKMLRRHRLAERFLTEKLGMEWSEVHDIACRLEHSFTDDMIEPLEKLLENPTTCPHGNPVAANLSGRGDERPLPEWPPARKGIVSRVTEEKTDLLRYLASLGLTPGTEIRVDERAPFNGPILVRVRGSRYALGREVAERIRVKSV